MLAAKKQEPVKSKSENSAGPSKSSGEAGVTQAGLNPVWYHMATQKGRQNSLHSRTPPLPVESENTGLPGIQTSWSDYNAKSSAAASQPVQPKKLIGEPDDVYEQDTFKPVAGPAFAMPHACLGGNGIPHCR